LETKTAYIARPDNDAEMVAEALALFESAGITPRRLVALAHACRKCRELGFAKVVATWVNSLPELLLVEESKMWR
jgi:hypothetical protein